MIGSEVYSKISKFTKSPLVRLNAMSECIAAVDEQKIEGDIVECGVWRGGNIILSRILSPERVCWLYDTFKGMPDPGPYDTKRSGVKASKIMEVKPEKRMCVADQQDVKKCLQATGTYDETKLRFIEGKVEDTLQIESNIPAKIAVLRLDTDWYESTKIELEKLWPRVVKGGYLIVDDYGHWMGARKAVVDYFKDVRPFKSIDYSAVMLVKT